MPKRRQPEHSLHLEGFDSHAAELFMACELRGRALSNLFCFDADGRIFSFENSLLMHQDSCLGYTSFSGNCLCNVYNPPTAIQYTVIIYPLICLTQC